MTHEGFGAGGPVDDVRTASDRWWSAHESGAPAETVERLWVDLDRLCRSRSPLPADDVAERFGWSSTSGDH